MAGNQRLICAARDLVDGEKGVRFTVDRGNRPVSAFVVRFGGKVYGYLNECGHVRPSSTGSLASSLMIPSYTWFARFTALITRRIPGVALVGAVGGMA